MIERVQVAIIGGGPAGLSAATEAAKAGAHVVLFDENAAAGGQLRYRLADVTAADGSTAFPPRLAGALAHEATAAGIEIRTNSRVWGAFPGRSIGVEREGVSTTVEAERILIASGSIDRSLPFPGGSLPGVFSARAVQILLNVHLVLPGRRFAVIADEPEASELCREIMLAGGEVVAAIPTGFGELAASGDAGITRFRCEGIERDVDVVVVAAGRLADAGLALMAECEAGYSAEFGGFTPKLDQWMQTSVDGIFAAGDAAGPCRVEDALAEGAYAGVCMAASLGLRHADEVRAARERYRAATGDRAELLASVPGGFVQVDRVPMGVTAE